MFLHDVIQSVAKDLRFMSPWSVAIGSIMMFSLASCYDIGDRDNPLDPGAGNYVAYEESSSSSVIPDSVPESASSSSTKVNEPAEASSSSKKVVSSSSAKSSSSKNVKSSSSKETKSSSSSVTRPSSSSKPVSSSSVIPDTVPELASSSSKVTEPVEVSSSSKPVSSSSVIPNSVSGSVSSSSKKVESSSSEDSWTCGTTPLIRDGVEYKTVVIKEKCFTKENMRYIPNGGGNTMCYGGKTENCETYGLLYDFEAASLACPTGWRLPTSAEYIDLQDYSGDDMYDAGTHFKATKGWTGENGDDFLEFTALPGGYCDDDGCYGLGSMGYWWTSTEKVKNASHLTLFLNGDGGAFTAEKKLDNEKFASVRCVKIQK